MAEDKHGRLWLATMPTLNVFDPKTEKSVSVSYPMDLQNDADIEVYTFRYDENQDIMWLGTNHGLLYSQGTKEGLIKEFINLPTGHDQFRTICTDKKDNLWLAGEYGLHRYDMTTCNVRTFHRPGENPDVNNDDGFMSSFMDNKGILWIGNWSYGLMSFDTKTYEKKNYYFADPDKIQNGILAINNTGDPDEEHILWLATTDGIKTFDTRDHVFTGYLTDDVRDLYGIQGAGFSLQPTKTEGLWIGTYRGLHRYDPHKQKISVVRIPLQEGVKNWKITDMCFESSADRDSIMWFSVPYNTVFRYDITHKKLLEIPEKFRKYCTQKIGPYTLFIDSEDVLWVSSLQHGILGYDLHLKHMITPGYSPELKEKPKILKIIEDKNDKLWFGSINGIYTYDRGKNLIFPVTEIKNYLAKNNQSFTTRITTDKKGKIWFATESENKADDGIFCFDPLSKKITPYLQKDHKPLQILSKIESIYGLSSDKLIITSFNGFCVMKINRDSSSFLLFDKYNDKPLGGFRNVIEDNTGSIWMSSDIGISKFNPQTHTISNYTSNVSSIGQMPFPDLSFSNTSNTLYIGQDQAINMIDLSDLTQVKSGKLILSEMKILHLEYKQLPQSGDIIDLPYDQNTFHFEFTNLNFTNSHENTYRYSLGDTHDTWTNMESNVLNFNNLGYGKYTLKVESENSFGSKSPEPFVLRIHIRPPFWRTWWFNGLIIFIISCIIYYIFRYRDIQRQKVEKLRISIARDLHDDMGSSLSHIRMLSEREAMRTNDWTPYKNIADKTAEVMNNMSEIIWSINPVNDNLLSIIMKIQEFAIETFDPMGINLKFRTGEISPDLKLSPEDRRHIYLIFKESINNAAKYSQATHVVFSVMLKNRTYTIEFIDNGVGFDPIIIKRGNGLKNMEYRAKLLHGNLTVNTGPAGTSIALMFTK